MNLAKKQLVPGDRFIPWIKEVAAEFATEPVKFHSRINCDTLTERTAPSFEIKYIDIGNVNSDGQVLYVAEMEFADAPSRARRVLHSGDTIVSTVRTYLRAIAFIEKQFEGHIGSTGFAVFSPKPELHPKFLYYWLRSEWIVNEVSARSTGVSYPAIAPSVLGSFPVPIIPLDLQRAIADFLDSRTAAIDGVIEKKTRLIGLLKEKRLALITHAVTKGLDPSAPMRDTGIPWLGKIPAHWEVRKLKNLASVTFSNADKHTVEGEVPVRLCNYLDVYNHDFVTAEMDFMEATATKAEIAKFALMPGDIMVTKDSESWEDIAVPAYVVAEIPGVICGYHLALIRPKATQVDGRFLLRAFAARGINDQFRVAANGITRFGLGKDGLTGGLFPKPPVNEQRQIADYIDAKSISIDSVISKITGQIEKLREYRQALITAAVTGKIEIRSRICKKI